MAKIGFTFYIFYGKTIDLIKKIQSIKLKNHTFINILTIDNKRFMIYNKGKFEEKINEFIKIRLKTKRRIKLYLQLLKKGII